jgi:hypothetical protein
MPMTAGSSQLQAPSTFGSLQSWATDRAPLLQILTATKTSRFLETWSPSDALRESEATIQPTTCDAVYAGDASSGTLRVGHVPSKQPQKHLTLLLCSCLKVHRLTSLPSRRHRPTFHPPQTSTLYLALLPDISSCLSEVPPLPSENRVRILGGIAASETREANGEGSVVSWGEDFPFLHPLHPHIISPRSTKGYGSSTQTTSSRRYSCPRSARPFRTTES